MAMRIVAFHRSSGEADVTSHWLLRSRTFLGSQSPHVLQPDRHILATFTPTIRILILSTDPVDRRCGQKSTLFNMAFCLFDRRIVVPEKCLYRFHESPPNDSDSTYLNPKAYPSLKCHHTHVTPFRINRQYLFCGFDIEV